LVEELTIVGTPSASILLRLNELFIVRSQPKAGRLITFATRSSSTPRLLTDPRFWNRVAVAPTDGGTGRAIRASFVSLL